MLTLIVIGCLILHQLTDQLALQVQAPFFLITMVVVYNDYCFPSRLHSQLSFRLRSSS
jgi:hypothetical protein